MAETVDTGDACCDDDSDGWMGATRYHAHCLDAALTDLAARHPRLRGDPAWADIRGTILPSLLFLSGALTSADVERLQAEGDPPPAGGTDAEGREDEGVDPRRGRVRTGTRKDDAPEGGSAAEPAEVALAPGAPNGLGTTGRAEGAASGKEEEETGPARPNDRAFRCPTCDVPTKGGGSNRVGGGTKDRGPPPKPPPKPTAKADEAKKGGSGAGCAEVSKAGTGETSGSLTANKADPAKKGVAAKRSTCAATKKCAGASGAVNRPKKRPNQDERLPCRHLGCKRSLLRSSFGVMGGYCWKHAATQKRHSGTLLSQSISLVNN